MKKKGIAALALAGALAATMVPAFAAVDATGSTSVGYTANAIVSVDGDVMVTIPKSVTFTDTQMSITGFDIQAYVWNTTTGQWAIPTTTNGLSITKQITVTVDSANGFKLANTSYSGVTGTYEYKVNNAVIDDGGSVGTLTGSGTSAVLAGTLELKNAPKLDKNADAALFSDTLTYSFSGLDNAETTE